MQSNDEIHQSKDRRNKYKRKCDRIFMTDRPTARSSSSRETCVTSSGTAAPAIGKAMNRQVGIAAIIDMLPKLCAPNMRADVASETRRISRDDRHNEYVMNRFVYDVFTEEKCTISENRVMPR